MGVHIPTTLEEDAMKTLTGFVTGFPSLIFAVLSSFDRVRFTGHRPISSATALEGFVDHVLRIRRCEFIAVAEKQSEIVVDHAKRLAERAGAGYEFLQDSHREEAIVDKILRERPISPGL
jgi:hypothetical protein